MDALLDLDDGVVVILELSWFDEGLSFFEKTEILHVHQPRSIVLARRGLQAGRVSPPPSIFYLHHAPPFAIHNHHQRTIPMLAVALPCSVF